MHYNWATYLHSLNETDRLQEALVYYNVTRQLNPSHAGAMNNLANLLEQLKASPVMWHVCHL